MLIFKKKFSKGQEAAENSWLGGRASVSQVGRGDYLVGSGPGRAGLAGKDGRMHWAGTRARARAGGAGPGLGVGWSTLAVTDKCFLICNI